MKTHTRAALCCGLSVGLLAPIHHESIAATDNKIVVTASRIEAPAAESGSSLSVITAEHIARQNASDLQQALKLVPGLAFDANGGPGTSSRINIRGAESDHTLVLLNGNRINSNTDGDVDFSSIPVSAIESIEVVRGPQSGLHGADAMGGVINIITRKGTNQPLSGTASFAVGELGYYEGNLTLSGGNSKVDVLSSISYYNLDGHDIAKNNGGTEDDPYDRLSIFNNIGANFAGDGRADLTVWYIEDDAKLDAFRGEDNPEDMSRKKKTFTTLAISKPITDTYSQRLSAGYNHQNYEGFVSGMFGGPNEFTTESYDLALQADLNVTENNLLSAGYDARLTEAENVGNFDKQDRTQHAIFLRNSWSWQEALFLNLSGRFDTYSDIDDQATWKADASWFALDATRLHGSIGTAYRAPTMNDLYFTYGAPARTYLNPEESISMDIGVEQMLWDDKLIADITYFRSDIEELIEWTPTAIEGLWEPRNVDEADIQGVEITINAKPHQTIDVNAFVTFLDAENAQTGKDLSRRADLSAGISLHWACSKRSSVYSDLTYTGDRYDDAENETKLDSYTLIGLGVRYSINQYTDVFGHVSNLTDENYETAAGYASVGRLASIGISGSL